MINPNFEGNISKKPSYYTNEITTDEDAGQQYYHSTTPGEPNSQSSNINSYTSKYPEYLFEPGTSTPTSSMKSTSPRSPLCIKDLASKSDQKFLSKYRTKYRPKMDDISKTLRRKTKRSKKFHEEVSTPKSLPFSVNLNEKLGTFSGVYVPTCLNVLSILMFLRFGVLLGQAGLLGIMSLLVASYIINLVTTLSLSAIASNGTVRGGGAYYLISRSLGPEFGGSIGAIFYFGLTLNTGMNAVGLIDCIKLNFGTISGNWIKVLPESQWYNYLWSTVVLMLCTGLCFAGSSIFARASNGLLIVLMIATLSIPLSSLFVSPFENKSLGIEYTGPSLKTFTENLKPLLMKETAAGQSYQRDSYQTLFGILFPATGGIFAGASMSGDLKTPSKSIPRGTLYGLGTTFILYSIVILAMAFTTKRSSLIVNANVIQDTNVSGLIILAGELASALFSTLMGVIGSAKLLQALARDNLLPGSSIFKQGSPDKDEPTYAIILTYLISQIMMLCDLNQLASFVTMTYLMTFLVMNLACFLLEIGSAPNFRPSFNFFNWQTALFGTIISALAMLFVDRFYAIGFLGILIFIFLFIHYNSPPKSWGDVSQSLIYHQVRKYLLRLKQEHVKFWRPQILLFVNDPRRQYKLIQFCNSMKKGALYILGHVIVTDDFGGSVPEARSQQAAWSKYIDFSKIKAFVNIAISPGVEWGARNIVMTSGLGGMRPNIAVLGFYNLDDFRRQPLINLSDSPTNAKGTEFHAPTSQSRNRKSFKVSEGNTMSDVLPTDSCKTEGMMSVTSYVTILEDLLLRLQINVAIAKGFEDLDFPSQDNHSKKFIDLWPIQMSAEITTAGENRPNLLTTNFDTYTLILQLGVILNTVPAWKKAYKIRVAVFVEYETDVEEERGRVESLLENLRIEARVLVFWLASGNFATYEIIVNGASYDPQIEEEVEEYLKGQDWWDEIQRIRGKRGNSSGTENLSEIASLFMTGTNWPESSFQQGPRETKVKRFNGLQRLLKKTKKKQSMSRFAKLGVSLGMRTHRLTRDILKVHSSQVSASEDSSSSHDEGSISDLDSDKGIASEGDVEDFEFGSEPEALTSKIYRRKSHGDAIRGTPSSKRLNDENQIQLPEGSNPGSSTDESKLAHEQFSCLDLYKLSLATSYLPKTIAPESKKENKSPQNEVPGELSAGLKFNAQSFNSRSRPETLSKHASKPKFSSKPVPATRIATEDGPGPSIMFTETPPPSRFGSCLPSAYLSETNASNAHPETTKLSSSPRVGSSYSTQNLPLSFNDLPSRAQHLILNELMRLNTKETAVMFTTLPSPAEGTGLSEEASSAYLGDLELLCRGCPPVLMVHSNSMTVTMNL
ncbi:BgTH12-02939 [Blumeria graminis f. sp. triticale]|nr:BgTH12-02939 [Blumeria graminis f. sp. triticale]